MSPGLFRNRYLRSVAGIFRFKQFDVNQEGCAMKVNTDGVLLGGLVSQQQPAAILDIGTGTGVIALMLAQRYQGAIVDAVEVDGHAASRAAENFRNAPFSARMNCYHTDFADFNPVRSYDLMVSNPPYFIYSLKNDSEKKAIARHGNVFFFDHLLQKAGKWLSDRGTLQIILPLPTADVVEKKADKHRLFLMNRKDIRSFADKGPVRTILTLGKQPARTQPLTEVHTIYAERGTYTAGYRQLLKDFFLAF